MKPLRLEVRGFTAFREPVVVDFEQRRLFVITGPTGAGKSSLLDAMIWALYGQVPRVGRSTRQLITHGESSMAVRFDFTARGERYRVSRKAPTTVGTRLERLNEDGQWQPLADRAREVTAQVSRILGLDYATFTRTVVLPQGAFDSFLRGDDSDRRAILTRLLGLDSYEAVGRAARARGSESKKLATTLQDQVSRLSLAAPGAAAALERDRGELEAGIAGVEDRRERVAGLGKLARASDEARTALEAARAACRRAETALAASTKARSEAERAAAVARQAASALGEEREQLGYDAERHGRLRELGAVLVQRDEAAEALAAAEQELAAGEQRETAARAVAAEHEQHAAAASEGLTAVTAVLAMPSRGPAEPHATVAAARERLSRLDTLAEQFESASGEQRQAERALKQAQGRSSTAAKAREQADAALTEAERRHAASREAFDGARMQQAAATLQRELQPGDPCPVCGEPVGEVPHGDFPDLDDAERAVSDAATALTQARTASAAVAEAATKTAAAASHTAEALEAALARLTALGTELAQLKVKPAGVPDASAGLRAALQAYERAVEEARTSSERTVQTSEQLKGEQRAVAAAGAGRQRAAKALAAVEQRLAAASIDQTDGAGDPDSLRDALAQSERRAARARELDAAIATAGVTLAEAAVRHEERDSERDRLAGEVRERAATVAAAEQAETIAREAFETARAGLAHEGAIDAADVPDVAAVESLFRQLDGEAKRSAEALGGLRERIERARIEAEDATRLRAEVQQQERAASIASSLAIELHGDRFIAYVQREALRVLAADASARLHQLTNGRYQLVLDDREFAVVDHLNGDEQRSVKTLSGGETFLTSLALSLALSERLPELAGTGGAVSLESLFLDEGFGSLDADALDVAIEGLEALADPSAEGRLVGVISHVPQLAERLDDRIEVRVGETTSTVLAS